MASPPDVVLGQGSLGTLFAAVLGQGNRPVHLVSRRADTQETIRVRAKGRTSMVEASVERVPTPPERARLVLVATRADQALERAREAQPSLTDEGAIVPLQNGLAPLAIADELGPEDVVPAVVGFNAHLVDDRTAEITSPGGITTGALDPAARPAVDALVEAVGEPIHAKTSDNPAGAIWSKWCVSCAINGLAVVAGEGVGPMTRHREGREALVGVLTEGTRLADAEDVDLERVAGPLAPDTLAGNGTRGLGGAFRRGVVWLIGRRYSDVTPSSIRALREGRDPELDTLNREAVRRGEELGVPTPWNRATLALAEEVAAGKRQPAMANLAEVRERSIAREDTA